MKKQIDTEEIYEKAVTRLFKCFKESGRVHTQPVEGLSEVGSKYVHLANSNGEIAKYVIKDDKLLFPDGTTW